MQAHVIAIEQEGGTPLERFRWRCSCGDVGPWKGASEARRSDWQPRVTGPRRARNGGARHVAAMERGKR